MADDIKNVSKPVIVLEHLDGIVEPIKRYIDDLKNIIKTENEVTQSDLVDDLKTHIQDVKNEVQNNFESEYDALKDKLKELEQTGTIVDIELIKKQMQDLINRYEEIKTTIDNLSNVKPDVLNEDDVKKLVNTALIDQTRITDDSIETSSAYIKELFALIAKFGTVKASNIEGDVISGHTVQSGKNITGTNTPTWQLNNDGSGHLANDNIRWNGNGEVTFGSGVTIGFDKVIGAQKEIENLLDKYDIDEHVKEAIRLSGAVSLETLEEKLKESTENLNKKLADLEESQKQYTTGNDLDGAIEAALEEARTAAVKVVQDNYDLTATEYKDAIEEAREQLQRAIETGDLKMQQDLNEVILKLTNSITAINSNYASLLDTLNSLKGDIGDLGNSALTSEAIQKLLSTTLINNTTISGKCIATPSLLAKDIVSLIGTFGTINASKIVGTNIQGYTVSSPLDKKDANGNYIYTNEPEPALDENGNPMKDENGNPIYASIYDPIKGEYKTLYKKEQIKEEDAAWVLKSDGLGHLANGNISWSKNGGVRFNGALQYTWEEVDMGDALEDKLNEYPELTYTYDKSNNTYEISYAFLSTVESDKANNVNLRGNIIPNKCNFKIITVQLYESDSVTEIPTKNIMKLPTGDAYDGIEFTIFNAGDANLHFTNLASNEYNSNNIKSYILSPGCLCKFTGIKKDADDTTGVKWYYDTPNDPDNSQLETKYCNKLNIQICEKDHDDTEIITSQWSSVKQTFDTKPNNEANIAPPIYIDCRLVAYRDIYRSRPLTSAVSENLFNKYEVYSAYIDTPGILNYTRKLTNNTYTYEYTTLSSAPPIPMEGIYDYRNWDSLIGKYFNKVTFNFKDIQWLIQNNKMWFNNFKNYNSNNTTQFNMIGGTFIEFWVAYNKKGVFNDVYKLYRFSDIDVYNYTQYNSDDILNNAINFKASDNLQLMGGNHDDDNSTYRNCKSVPIEILKRYVKTFYTENNDNLDNVNDYNEIFSTVGLVLDYNDIEWQLFQIPITVLNKLNLAKNNIDKLYAFNEKFNNDIYDFVLDASNDYDKPGIAKVSLVFDIDKSDDNLLIKS